VNTNIQRDYARAPRGEIIEGLKSGQNHDRINVIGALCVRNHFGIKCYRNTTDSAFFLDWFENCLLKEIPKCFTAIMDNAKYHRKAILRKLARGKIRLLFLPPYSPDYNPIEKSWANMKRYIRNNIQIFKMVEETIYDYFGHSDS
jgi:hypothetical protein